MAKRRRNTRVKAVRNSFLRLPLWAQITVVAVIVLVVLIAWLNQPRVQLPDGELRITVIDVGNADSILVQSNEEAMLIDAGERGDGDDVLKALKENGVSSLDYVIATHADGDHIGGMQTVLEGIAVKKYIMSTMADEYLHTTKTYLNVMSTIDDKDIELVEAQVGQQFTLGEAKVDILGPVKDFEEKNDQSVICKITFGEKKFLFMGDAETAAEAALLATDTDLSADVIKVGHHGSSTGTTQALMDRVRPQIALITCGAGNSYGHPHRETLLRLKNNKVQVYRSDVNGTITLQCDGREITVLAEKGEAA